MLFLFVVFLITAGFTIRLRRATSDIQDAIREDARVRIEESKEETKRSIHAATEQARVDIQKARDDADSKLKAATKESEAQIAVAHTEALKASATAAIANQRAAEANKKAEEEKLARLKIEEYFSPRAISDVAAQELVASLSAISGETATLFIVSGDAETFSFATRLEALLKEAGVTAHVTEGMIVNARTVGISFQVGKDRLKSLDIVATAFDKAGFREKGKQFGYELSTPDDRFMIIVGPKH